MKKLFYLSQCPSTNDEIHHYLALGNNDYTGLFTLNQTKGRGQYGNYWETEPDQNLAYTLAVKTENFLTSDTLINYYTATMLRDFIANLTKSDAKIKWPNDIIIKNKKISGMLIEKKKIEGNEFLIIGIGVNVLQRNFENLPKAGSLLTQTALTFELKNVAEQLHHHFIKKLKEDILEDEAIENFNKNLFRKDEVSVFEIKKTRQNGIIKSADKEGFLWVELENDGLKKFYHKEISLLY